MLLTRLGGGKVKGPDVNNVLNPMKFSSLREGPSMKNACFTPFDHHRIDPNIQRIGVPGHGIYEHNMSVLRRWSGTSFQEVLMSRIFLCYLFILVMTLIAFSQVTYSDELRATNLDGWLKSSITSLCIFILTFFLTSTVSKVNTRFENVCKTNGFVTRLSALAGALYPPPEAKALMRYTNSIMFVYYFLMSGPMNKDKWDIMAAKGLLTDEEIEKLQLQGSPGVVLYCWALHILKFSGGEPAEPTRSQDAEQALLAVNHWAQGMNPLQLNMEACIGGTRGLAAKQIAYSLFQTPLIYFHAVFVSVNIYLLCTIYDTAHVFARSLHEPCFLMVANPTPEHINVNDDELYNGTCPTAGMTVIVGEVVVLFTYLTVLKAGEKLSDAYGPRAYHYDLGVDLENLWKESQNVLASMSVPRPKIR